MRKPVPLVGPVTPIDEALPASTFPSSLTCELDPAETKRILTTAKSLQVTVNDLLIRDAFLAVGAWREQQGSGNGRDWLRFSVPMNLRTAADERMSMANSVSMVFLDRKTDDFHDTRELLDGIHQEMSLIKRLDLKYTFIFSLNVARWMPSGMIRETRADQCHSSCCVSNLGPVLAGIPLPRRDGRIVSGDIVLNGVDYAIPLRPHVNAAFCLYTYAGRLQILLSFDSRAITPEGAQRLLDLFVSQIRQSVATTTGCGTPC